MSEGLFYFNVDYTIPRTTRELQLLSGVVIFYL